MVRAAGWVAATAADPINLDVSFGVGCAPRSIQGATCSLLFGIESLAHLQGVGRVAPVAHQCEGCQTVGSGLERDARSLPSRQIPA
jgi:hypothetical protein